MPKITSRGARHNLLFILLLCGVLPFLVNALFAHPWTDDYYFSVATRVDGYFDALRDYYTGANGRYFSVSLMLLNPLAFGQLWGYKLIPLLLAGGLFTAILSLTSACTGDTLATRERGLFALAVLLVYLDQMPDIRPGLYWMAGSLTYQVAAILALLLAAMLIRLRSPLRPAARTACGLTGLLLTAGLAGTNEVALFLLLLALSLATLVTSLGQGKLDRWLLAILAVACSGAGAVLLAPGNRVRLGSYQGSGNLLLAMQQSLEAAAKALLVWPGTPAVLTLTGLVVFAVQCNPRLRSRLRAVHPGLALALLMLFLTAGFFPPFYATGLHPARRVLNMLYLLFLVGWLVNVAVFATRIDTRRFDRLKEHLPKRATLVVVPLFFCLLAALGHSNLLLVCADLASGRSWRFDRELRQRYQALALDSCRDCEVPPLQNTPASLFFSDINFSREGWINQSYAHYYGKDSIRLRRGGGS